MSERRDRAQWHDEEMRAYLLGTLSIDRKDSLEERIFDDDTAYDALLDARYDLLDDYARGSLSAPERERVEHRLLGQPGHDALGLATLLASREGPDAASATPDGPTGHRPLRLIALAAVAVLAIGAILWLAVDNRRLRAELANLARATTVPTSLLRPADADGQVARLELTPRTTRGADTPGFTLAPTAAVVEIVVPVDDVAPEYRVTLEGREGVLWTERGVTRAPDGTLHVWLAAARLPDGAYEFLVHVGPSADAPLVVAIPFRIRR